MLKPGQTSLDRDYYAQATHEKPDGKVALQNFGRFDSGYNQNVSSTVQVGDYQVPQKNANTMSNLLIHLTQLQLTMNSLTIQISLITQEWASSNK